MPRSGAGCKGAEKHKLGKSKVESILVGMVAMSSSFSSDWASQLFRISASPTILCPLASTRSPLPSSTDLGLGPNPSIHSYTAFICSATQEQVYLNSTNSRPG